MDPVFLKGVLAFVGSTLVFVGSIYLVLSMVLGWRMGYLVSASTFFGILTILGAMWVGNALGPKGPETTWHAIAVGNLGEIESGGETYNVSDYPEGAWEAPKQGRHIADLRKAPSPCLSLFISCTSQDTQTEVANIRPVMESLVSQATSPIPGKRDDVSDLTYGEVGLESGEFALADIRIKEAEVEGKTSLIAVARAVPSEVIRAESLEGAPEGTVERYLLQTGDEISAGTAIAEVRIDSGTIQIRSTGGGRFLSPGLSAGDKVRPGIAVAVADVSGLPGKPEAVEVAAVRVRGAVRSLAIRYLIVFASLFALHMFLLARAERAKKSAVQPAAA